MQYISLKSIAIVYKVVSLRRFLKRIHFTLQQQLELSNGDILVRKKVYFLIYCSAFNYVLSLILIL